MINTSNASKARVILDFAKVIPPMINKKKENVSIVDTTVGGKLLTLECEGKKVVGKGSVLSDEVKTGRPGLEWGI